MFKTKHNRIWGHCSLGKKTLASTIASIPLQMVTRDKIVRMKRYTFLVKDDKNR